MRISHIYPTSAREREREGEGVAFKLEINYYLHPNSLPPLCPTTSGRIEPVVASFFDSARIRIIAHDYGTFNVVPTMCRQDAVKKREIRILC